MAEVLALSRWEGKNSTLAAIPDEKVSRRFHDDTVAPRRRSQRARVGTAGITVLSEMADRDAARTPVESETCCVSQEEGLNLYGQRTLSPRSGSPDRHSVGPPSSGPCRGRTSGPSRAGAAAKGTRSIWHVGGDETIETGRVGGKSRGLERQHRPDANGSRAAARLVLMPWA